MLVTSWPVLVVQLRLVPLFQFTCYPAKLATTTHDETKVIIIILIIMKHPPVSTDWLQILVQLNFSFLFQMLRPQREKCHLLADSSMFGPHPHKHYGWLAGRLAGWLAETKPKQRPESGQAIQLASLVGPLAPH